LFPTGELPLDRALDFPQVRCPDELQQAIRDTPWEYEPFANAEREQLENSTPEDRHVHYGDLELRVVALSKDELEISGVFGKETL
jgi:hypothetical protein